MVIKVLNFLFQKRIFKKEKRENNICINVFSHENNPVFISDYTVCISKILTDLCVIKQKNKNKIYFCRCCLECFSSEKILIKHKKNCLIINGKENVKLKSGSVGFKTYFIQLAVTFKLYADLECLLKKVQSSDRNNDSS